MTPDANALDVALREIEARANNAMPGPWAQIVCDGERKIVVEGIPVIEGDVPGISEEETVDIEIASVFPTSDPADALTASFIANSITDVPRLLRVIAKLREQRNTFNGNDTPSNIAAMDAELLSILKGEA